MPRRRGIGVRRLTDPVPIRSPTPIRPGGAAASEACQPARVVQPWPTRQGTGSTSHVRRRRFCHRDNKGRYQVGIHQHRPSDPAPLSPDRSIRPRSTKGATRVASVPETVGRPLIVSLRREGRPSPCRSSSVSRNRQEGPPTPGHTKHSQPLRLDCASVPRRLDSRSPRHSVLNVGVVH
jgi:hypothetical protein